MSTATVITEDDIKLWLVGENDSDAERAILWIHKEYAERVIGFLNKRFPGLPLDDKKTALSQTYEALWDEGRSKTLNINKALANLIFNTAYRKAVDLLRYNTRQKRTIPDQRYHKDIAEALHGSAVESQWAILENRDLADDVIADFKHWMGTLPPAQQRVAYIIADGFPRLRDPKEIHDIMMECDKVPPSYESIKRYRRIILDKFRSAIKSKYEGIWS